MSTSLILGTLFSFVLAAAGGTGGLGSAPSGAATPAGSYCGQLASGDAIVPARTELSIGDGGRLEGRYVFEEGKEKIEGKLWEDPIATGAQRRLLWRDRFGEGTLRITFEDDFGAFVGLWGSGDETPTAPWNGRRCRDEISDARH